MTNIRSGLKQFMNQIIDYAGMFPPARLDFASAFANYLNYQNHKDHWMLERFVFPIKETDSLEFFRSDLEHHKPEIKLSVLPKYSDSAEDFLAEFRSDLARLTQTIKQLPAKFDYRVFEFKFPKELMKAEPKSTNDFLTELFSITKNQHLNNPLFFIEIHFDEDWEFRLTHFIKLLKNHLISDNLGFKLRCGGITSNLFPDSELVATAIHLSNQYKIPIKFTAGLHHPIRHFSEAVQTKMYGFFNIFGAAIIAKFHSISIKNIEEILVDESSENFRFSEHGMKWKELEVTTEEIKNAREYQCFSYGSCSFDEPREDLQKLDLL